MSFKELVLEKVGEASMCWSECPSGLFEEPKAALIAKDIVSEHEEEIRAIRNGFASEFARSCRLAFENTELKKQLAQLKEKV